jgi:succinoglycan biosynthesis transport protein ExoP
MGDLKNGPNSVLPAGKMLAGSSVRSGEAGGGADVGFSTEGFLQILGRQWQVIAGTVGIVLVLAVFYLIFASTQYTSTSKLRVEPLGQQIMNASGPDNAREGEISADFLATECDVITSNPVLALALERIGQTKTLDGVQFPMAYLKKNLTVEVAKKGQTIDVYFDSHYPDEAVKIVAAVVDAYQAFESNHWRAKVRESLDLLESGKDSQRKELAQKTQRMLQLARENGLALDSDPDKNPSRERVRRLAEEVTQAHLDTINAKAAYDESIRSIANDPVRMQQVDGILKKPSYGGGSEKELDLVHTELFQWEARLADAQRQYLPNHPIIKTIQGRIDQLSITCIVAAQQWRDAAQLREDSLTQTLNEAQAQSVEQESRAVEYSQLVADVTSLKKMDDLVAAKVNDLDLVRGAGATNITVLNPAEIDGSPKPHKGRTLALSLVLGLIGGVGLACGRDWMDDRLRTQEEIRISCGAPVLGAVPMIATAFTAADRGQIVHNEPFGIAAEAYRTLRTALQFALPPTAKTLLVTSAAPGEGKSTFVSNLAITLAQMGKHILVVDADLRAPMQHRLFGLKDRMGLATVLGGPDLVELAIIHTGIPGLDLLPCGPIPANPAEMLNEASFVDLLNDLADKYDLVILDSPPVTAVTDARIIAASVDATLVVIRPEASTRKQAHDARDGLRSVGARVIGVAVNGVSSSAQFGGATGYYTKSQIPTMTSRAGIQRPEGPVKAVAGPVRRG